MRPSTRIARLRSDFEAMRRLEGKVISVRACGDPPDRYELDLRIRSIIGPEPTYRSEHRVEVTLHPGYPDGPPAAMMITRPQPFHPNWYLDGRWCYGHWSRYEGLADFVLRMARTVQFTAAFTNPKSPANVRARDWYIQNLRRGIFPSDPQILPDPTSAASGGASKRFAIVNTGPRRHFQIK